MARIAIINSKIAHQIGDALSAIPALTALRPRGPLAVYFSCPLIAALIDPTRVTLLEESTTCDVLDIIDLVETAEDAGLNLIQTWYRALQLPIPTTFPRDWSLLKPIEPAFLTDIIIGPFSNSDVTHDCKECNFAIWIEVLMQLRAKNLTIALACGAAEAVEPFRPFVNRIVAGRPLSDVAAYMKAAACVLTIDNGLSWLAQAYDAPHVLLANAIHRPTWTPDWRVQENVVNLNNVRSVHPDQIMDAVYKIYPLHFGETTL